MQSERYPLPFGWIKEFDQTSGHPFYVDTKATPPRSIWTHPYEDDEYLKAHPDVREKINTTRFGGSELNLPPPSFEESQRRHSSGAARPSCSSQQSQPIGMPVAGSSRQNHRGPIGALGDRLFGTKEERKADKIRRKEEKRARREAQRLHDQQVHLARQQYYTSQPQYAYHPGGLGGGGFAPSNRGRGGGLALPLLGGLAGGLLLGELLDDGFGGGFGGGDFGGGGFGF